MLTDEDIFNRYETKKAEFSKQADVSLIGHSLFDMWGDLPDGTPTLAGKSVANLGISGVSTRQYLDVIAKPHRLTSLGQTIFLFLGVNDITKEPDYSPQQVLDWLNEIIALLKVQAPNARYFLLEATPVNNISTVTNAQIIELNDFLRSHCPADLTFVETQYAFRDEEGKLQSALCTDGLHFSPQGYQVLKNILEAQL